MQLERIPNEKRDDTLVTDRELTRFRAQHQAWEAYATGALQMIPVLKAHITGVTQETERAALELSMHLRVLGSIDTEVTSADRSASVSQAVMAM